MKVSHLKQALTRRGFAGMVARAGAGVVGAAALAQADDEFPAPPARRGARGIDLRDGDRHGHDDQERDDLRHSHLRVKSLPFDLQHEFQRAISCNNAVARAEEVNFDGAEQGHRHGILQRPGTFGWGTITYFLSLDRRLVGQSLTFFTTVGWSGPAQGDVMFSVDINGDIVIDGARTSKNAWVPVERTLLVNATELRITLMVDSIRGDNNFSFYWGEPSLRTGRPLDRGHDHDHGDLRRDDRNPLDRDVRPNRDR